MVIFLRAYQIHLSFFRHIYSSQFFKYLCWRISTLLFIICCCETFCCLRNLWWQNVQKM